MMAGRLLAAAAYSAGGWLADQRGSSLPTVSVLHSHRCVASLFFQVRAPPRQTEVLASVWSRRRCSSCPLIWENSTPTRVTKWRDKIDAINGAGMKLHLRPVQASAINGGGGGRGTRTIARGCGGQRCRPWASRMRALRDPAHAQSPPWEPSRARGGAKAGAPLPLPSPPLSWRAAAANLTSAPNPLRGGGCRWAVGAPCCRAKRT